MSKLSFGFHLKLLHSGDLNDSEAFHFAHNKLWIITIPQAISPPAQVGLIKTDKVRYSVPLFHRRCTGVKVIMYVYDAIFTCWYILYSGPAIKGLLVFTVCVIMVKKMNNFLVCSAKLFNWAFKSNIGTQKSFLLSTKHNLIC